LCIIKGRVYRSQSCISPLKTKMARFNCLIALFVLASFTAASLFDYNHEESGLYRRSGCGTKCFAACCGGSGPECVCKETCDPYTYKMPGWSSLLSSLIQCRVLIKIGNWPYYARNLGQAEGSSKESRYGFIGLNESEEAILIINFSSPFLICLFYACVWCNCVLIPFRRFEQFVKAPSDVRSLPERPGTLTLTS
jgi:hypothetical protein